MKATRVPSTSPIVAEAATLWKEFRAANPLTTNHVRGETWTFLQKRVGRHSAVGFAESLDQTAVAEVLFVSETHEDEAWRWLRGHDERPYSFVDATSFAVMRLLKIKEALAFGGDFAAAGFVELRA